MRQKFNPKNWLNTNEDGEPQSSNPQPSNQLTIQQSNHQSSNIFDDIDLLVSRIEAAHTDIAGNYADWRNLGFALADEFGEGGRHYYHQLSRFYSKYSYTDCNRQFDQCLKSTGHGITIKTLFHLAKQAGIDVTGAAVFNRISNNDSETGDGRTGAAVFKRTFNRKPETEDGRNENRERDMEQDAVKNRSSLPDLPTLPDSIFPTLPVFLQKVVEVADSKEERDILLLGSLGALSACFPKVWGIYDGKKVFSNLYLFVTAQASAGKGRLGFCKQLVQPVHWELRQEARRLQQAYEMEMKEYNLVKMKDANAQKPEKPPEKMLFIPANSTATGVFQLLADNEDRGLIFETEGDTLALAFKSDHGNYSDGFRKGAHHEMISYYRRTDREYREIKMPCISTVLSGTPQQVSTLIPSAENGLFSRFIFYHIYIRPIWKNVFAKRNEGLEQHFDLLGQDFFSLYKALRENTDMQFCLTDQQKDEFHTFFTLLQDKYLTFHGMDYMGTIRRLGLIVFRIAMIFTALRMMETGDFSENQICSDTDFHAALSMVRILIKHASHVFSELPVEMKLTRPKDRKEQFLDQLPQKFNCKEYQDLGRSLSIHERTAYRYITLFCDKGWICKDQKDSYIKITPQGMMTSPAEQGWLEKEYLN